MVSHFLYNKCYIIAFQLSQIDLELKDGRFLNINLYEIRLEKNITDNKTLLDSFFLDCHCALFLMDATNEDTFFSVQNIITTIDKDEFPYLKIILVDNKSDIKPETPNDELLRFIDENPEIDYISISVKTGENMEHLINKIYDEVNSSENKVFPIDKVSKSVLKDESKTNCTSGISLILLGNSGVGKTNFIERYTKNVFQPLFLSTNGISHKTKKLKINEQTIYNLTLWDTAGQERFRSIPRRYYQNSDGILILFDITDRNSFEEVSKWMSDINEYGPEGEEVQENGVVIYLIGNKVDLLEKEKEVISKEEIEELTKKLRVKYCEVSCKWNLNLEEAMARIILDCIKRNRQRTKSFVLKATDLKEKKNKKGGCCLSKKGNNQ